MNYLKLKQKIYEAIERNPLDRSAYEEINFTNMLSGKYPDRATLMEGTGDDLVK